MSPRTVEYAFLALAASMLTLVGCRIEEAHGNGVAAHEQRTVASFEQIDTRGIDVRVVIDPASHGDKVDLYGDANLLDFVRMRTEGNKLIIEADDDDRELRPHLPLVANVRVPHLTKVKAAESAHVDVTVVSATPLVVLAESSASIEARGELPRLDVELESSAEIRAKDLVARDVYLDGNGNSRAYVCATSKLDVDLDGSSRAVSYCDARTVEQDLSGSSHLDFDL